MTDYTSLPIYKSSYSLLLDIYKLTESFDRAYKFSLAEKLKTQGLDLLLFIYQANICMNKSERMVYIKKAIFSGESLRLLFRICKDLKLIHAKKYISSSITLEEMMRQLLGWKKYTERAGQ